MGAVQLFDNSGNLFTTTPIYGIGQGPAIAFAPGHTVHGGTGAIPLNQTRWSMAVDAAGDVFISNYAPSGQVVKVATRRQPNPR